MLSGLPDTDIRNHGFYGVAFLVVWDAFGWMRFKQKGILYGTPVFRANHGSLGRGLNATIR
jgi:hypothetical protein